MFELSALSTFLDIFQKAFGLIEKRRDQKRRLFEEIIDPIYTQLSPVVSEYYEFFRSCRDEFSQTEFKNWQLVLSERRKKREEIVFARNTVLGMISPFLSKQQKRCGEPDERLNYFAFGVFNFFYSSVSGPVSSEATRLFEYIDYVVERGNEAEKDTVIEEIELLLRSLEFSWQGISAAYGELRVYCLS